MGDVLGYCWCWSDPHPAHSGALAWRLIELEAAATELLVRSRIKPCSLLQPMHSKAPLLACAICSLDRHGSADAEAEETIGSSQRASCEAKRDHLSSSMFCLLYNALKILLHTATYLHSTVSPANYLVPNFWRKINFSTRIISSFLFWGFCGKSYPRPRKGLNLTASQLNINWGS